MRYTGYDYSSAKGDNGSGMDRWWDSHWWGRDGLKRDDEMRVEPLWATICDVVGRPGRLLEAGCGTGQWVRFFKSLGHDAVGVDFAESGLEVGRRHDSTLDLRQADFRNLPFDDNTFDYITSFGAVEHDIDGPELALKEFGRVLKPDGWLMCSVPCLNARRVLGLPWMALRDWLRRRALLRRLWRKTDPFLFYQYMWTPGAYRRILAECGYVVDRMRGYGTACRSGLSRSCDRALGIVNLSLAHMMMAICRKSRSETPMVSTQD